MKQYYHMKRQYYRPYDDIIILENNIIVEYEITLDDFSLAQGRAFIAISCIGDKITATRLAIGYVCDLVGTFQFLRCEYGVGERVLSLLISLLDSCCSQRHLFAYRSYSEKGKFRLTCTHRHVGNSKEYSEKGKQSSSSMNVMHVAYNIKSKCVSRPHFALPYVVCVKKEEYSSQSIDAVLFAYSKKGNCYEAEILRCSSMERRSHCFICIPHLDYACPYATKDGEFLSLSH